MLLRYGTEANEDKGCLHDAEMLPPVLRSLRVRLHVYAPLTTVEGAKVMGKSVLWSVCFLLLMSFIRLRRPPRIIKQYFAFPHPMPVMRSGPCRWCLESTPQPRSSRHFLVSRCAGRRPRHTWTKGPQLHRRQTGNCSRIPSGSEKGPLDLRKAFVSGSFSVVA